MQIIASAGEDPISPLLSAIHGSPHEKQVHLKQAIDQIHRYVHTSRGFIYNQEQFSGFHDIQQIPRLVEHWNATHTTKLQYVEYLESLPGAVEAFARDASHNQAMILIGFKRTEFDADNQYHTQLMSLDKRDGLISAQVFEGSGIQIEGTNHPYFRMAKQCPEMRVNFHQIVTQFSRFDCLMYMFHILKRLDENPQFLIDMHHATFRGDSHAFHTDQESRDIVEDYLCFQPAWASHMVHSLNVAEEKMYRHDPEKFQGRVRFVDARPYFPEWGYAMTSSRTNLQLIDGMRKQLGDGNFLKNPINKKQENLIQYVGKYIEKFANEDQLPEYGAGIEYFRSRYAGNVLSDYVEALQ